MNRITVNHASIAQLTCGYAGDERRHHCLYCGYSTRRGQIYREGEDLVDAELALQRHITATHGSPFEALLATGKKGTGLSDIQRALLQHFHDGLADKEIQPLAGDVSLSTIRNHRFTLREKTRQAKALVALMELLEREDRDPGSRFIDIPGSRRADDERFAITRAEFDKIIQGHFPEGPEGRMNRMPKKEKRKIAVLIQVLKRFEPKRRYAHKEVDRILATASDDHVTLRRYLVDFGFMDRTADGREYWVE